jgi:hypothetical protein
VKECNLGYLPKLCLATKSYQYDDEYNSLLNLYDAKLYHLTFETSEGELPLSFGESLFEIITKDDNYERNFESLVFIF